MFFFSCTFLRNKIFLPRPQGHTFICKWHKALLFLDFYQKTHSNRKQNGFLSNWKEPIFLCNLRCDAGHYQKWMLSLEQHIFLSMSWRQRWSVNQSGADLPAEQTWTISCAIKRIINGCCYLHVIIEGLHVSSDKKLNLKIKFGFIVLLMTLNKSFSVIWPSMCASLEATSCWSLHQLQEQIISVLSSLLGADRSSWPCCCSHSW